MNENGENVNGVQLGENERCLNDFQRGELVAPMSFNICIIADRERRVQRAKERTVIWEQKKCDLLAVPPPFAYTNSATVNAAAVDGALELTYTIFGGPPVLDANLVTRANDTETAKCQFEMLKRANTLENTVVKEVNRAKRTALRDVTVNSDAALEARLQAVLSSNDRIARTQDRLVKGVHRKCADLPVSPDTIFPGYDCGTVNPDLNEVEECVIAAARCEACVKINAFDDLNLDCDQADDQNVNGSCDERDSGGHGLTNADCFDFDTCASEATSTWATMCCNLAEANPDMPFTPTDYQNMPDDCKPLVNPICR
jgi:hypothetical protein